VKPKKQMLTLLKPIDGKIKRKGLRSVKRSLTFHLKPLTLRLLTLRLSKEISMSRLSFENFISILFSLISLVFLGIAFYIYLYGPKS